MTVQKTFDEKRVSSMIATVLKEEVPKPGREVNCTLRCRRAADGTYSLAGSFCVKRSLGCTSELPLSQSDIFDFLYLALSERGFKLVDGVSATWRHMTVEPIGDPDADGSCENFKVRVSDLVH